MSALPQIDATPPPKPVGAVTAAISILRWLGAQAEPQRLSDIVRGLDLNTSTVLNILRTLDYEGLVYFDRANKRYALADGLADLAAPVLARHGPGQRFARAMDQAAHDLGATVALWRVVGQEVELVQVAESSAVMRIAFSVGRRLPMFLGAMGRLVAARGDFDAHALRAGFDRVPWTRAPDYAAWLDEVDTARQTGAAIDAGHVNRGILGVAVPVETEGGLIRIVAAAMFETDNDIPAIIDRLRTVAAVAD